MKFKRTRNEINDQIATKEHRVLSDTTVKSRPQYDPDAEITGLMLTVPSWIGSMERVRTKADFVSATESAKQKLCDSLRLLMEEAENTMKTVKGE